MEQSDNWSIEDAAYPFDAPFTERAKFLLRYATLAPSGHNTQPWLFKIENDRIDVFADRRRALPVVDPDDRELAISCGAAVAILEIAAAHFGFRPTTILTPDPQNSDLLARVDLSSNNGKQRAPSVLFTAITERRTTRARYSHEAPPNDLIEACAADAAAHGVGFDVFSSEDVRREIAGLVAEGDRIQFDDPAFRRELAEWVRSTRLGSRDGMSGTGFGLPDILAPVARFVIRTFDLGDGVAAADEETIVEGTPMLGLLSSANDDQKSWLDTGRVLAIILLRLTAAGFTASYLNQPIETATLRPRLKKVSGVSGFAQILIRIGKTSEKQPAAARRDLEDVLR